MTYRETLELLYALMPDFQQVGAAAYKPGLERAEEFVERLGNPHKRFRIIHVAGTNGKGSVSHMLTAVLMEAGYKVGLYTSPHLKEFRERIKVNAEMISEREVVEFTRRYLGDMEELDLSFFEATVGMAFSHFAEQRVDVAIVETGLGGRLDATNIVLPELSIITNIALEHTAILGDTVEAIAREKGGIIKPNTPVVIGQHGEGSSGVFREIAAERGAELHFAEDEYSIVSLSEEVAEDGVTPLRRYTIERLSDGAQLLLDLDLLGDYQKHNILTLLSAVEFLNSHKVFSIGQGALQSGLSKVTKSTGLRGRWQVLSHQPLMVADTGHNADGIRELVGQILKCNYAKLYIVFGVANDKDLDAIAHLLPTEAHYIFTRAAMDRAMSSEELMERMGGYGLRGETTQSVAQGVERAKELASADDMIFVGGSSFVVAELDL